MCRGQRFFRDLTLSVKTSLGSKIKLQFLLDFHRMFVIVRSKSYCSQQLATSHPLAVWVFALTILILFRISASAGEADRKRFSEFCKSKQQSLRSAYESCNYESQSTTDYGNGRAQVTESFVSVGGGLAVARTFVPDVKTSSAAPPFKEGDTLPIEGQRLTSITNERYFAMIGVDAERKHLLREIKALEQGLGRSDEANVYSFPLPGVRLLYSEIAESAESQVEAFVESKWDEKPAYMVLAQFPSDRYKEYGPLECEAYFDLEYGHCLAATVTIGKNVSKPQFVMEYDDILPGSRFPLLRRVTMDEVSKGVKTTTLFRNWKFGTLPKEECYLTYYGLPEPPDPNVKPGFSIPVWLWAFVVGVGLLVASMLVRQFRNRVA